MRLEDGEHKDFEERAKQLGIESLQAAGREAILEWVRHGRGTFQTAVGKLSSKEIEQVQALLEILREKPELAYPAIAGTIESWISKRRRETHGKSRASGTDPR